MKFVCLALAGITLILGAWDLISGEWLFGSLSLVGALIFGLLVTLYGDDAFGGEEFE